MNPTGETFGDYRILRRIAVGGTAEIFLAARENDPNGARVVLKILLPQYARDRAYVEMLGDEARLLRSLFHPNLLRLVDFGIVAGQTFVAMEQGSDVATENIRAGVLATLNANARHATAPVSTAQRSLVPRRATVIRMAAVPLAVSVILMFIIRREDPAEQPATQRPNGELVTATSTVTTTDAKESPTPISDANRPVALAPAKAKMQKAAARGPIV